MSKRKRKTRAPVSPPPPKRPRQGDSAADSSRRPDQGGAGPPRLKTFFGGASTSLSSLPLAAQQLAQARIPSQLTSSLNRQFGWEKVFPRKSPDVTPYCLVDLARDVSREVLIRYESGYITGGRDYPDFYCVQVKVPGSRRSRHQGTMIVDRKGSEKPLRSLLKQSDLTEFYVNLCGKLGTNELPVTTRIAVRNAAIAFYSLDPQKVHYFLQEPTFDGDLFQGLTGAIYTSSMVFFDPSFPEFQNIELRLRVMDVGLDSEIPSTPLAIRWVQGGVRTEDVDLRQCHFDYESIPIDVSKEDIDRHKRCISALRWLVYTFDGSYGSGKAIKGQLWEAYRLLQHS